MSPLRFACRSVLLVAVSLSWSCGGSASPTHSSSPLDAPPRAPTPDPVTILASGDISCDSAATQLRCQSRETSDLILSELESAPAALVLPLGDLQYEIGTLAEFQKSYHATWGRLNAVSRPVVGNHEYETRNASGYFDYFAAQGVNVGLRSEGWYSFDRGNWHFVALNSNCSRIGGCQVGSPQYRWLQANLLANQKKCTLAYMHHPLVSTGRNGNTPAVLPLMQLLYENKTELVLAGHDHNYERFVPMTPALVPDPAAGFRMFVVGVGGRELQAFGRAMLPSVAFRANDHFGVLRLVLRETDYDWAFLSTRGVTFDLGTGACF